MKKDNLKLKIGLGLVGLALVMVAFVAPSSDLADRVAKSLKTYQVNYSPEKVYIHHDKPYYMAGEVLWLKAYVLDASNLKSSGRSGVLYVDLLNQENEAVESLALPIEDGETHGDILLSEDLAEGVYQLAAYTQWMRNFGEEYFFQKDLYILDANREAKGPMVERDLGVEDGSINLQFFPEGGDLVAGLGNEVAFKAVDSQGYGLPISASLFDGDGRKVLDFEDNHKGMGSFTFEPESNKKYFAKLNFIDGTTKDYSLPEVQEDGYVLHMDEVIDPENLLVRISTNNKESQPLMLMGIAGDSLMHVENVLSATNQNFETQIPKSIFPNGIARFTLAMPNGEPLAERLVFVRHAESLQLNVNTDKAVYHPREEVNISLEVSGNSNKLTTSNFSVSVTAEELVKQPENQENIQSYLLLSSELRGNIESPGYYFESNEEARQTALRNLMMTQGWRRFDWNAIVSNEFPKIQYVNEMDLNLRGRLVKNDKPVQNGEAILYLRDQFQTFITTDTNEEGYFNFRGFYFKGNIEVVIQGSDHRGRREGVEVQMLDREVPSLSEDRIKLNEVFIAQLPEGYVLNTQHQFHSMDTEVWGMELGELLLKEIVVEGRTKIHEPFKLHHRADVVIHREQLPIAPSGNILEILQGRVPGLQVTKRGMNEFQAVIRGQGTPLYLLDGIPIAESTMQDINQFDISRIEILKSPGAVGIYGGRGGGGVIALFTNTGFEEVVDVDEAPYIIVHQASGFNRTRQFYSPVHESIDHYDLPDLRSTVFWNPTLSLQNNEQKTLSFYTADTPGRYRVIVEGISKEGQPIRQETFFEVGTGG